MFKNKKPNKPYSKELIQISKDLENKFIAQAEEVEMKQFEFLSKLSLSNSKESKRINIKFDLETKFKEDYFYFKQNAFLLQEQMKEENMAAFFYTATLKKEFHQKKGNGINENYNPKNTIIKGYDLLSHHHRKVYKNFKVKKKNGRRVNVPIKYICVFEGHKLDFCPHFHCIYFCPQEYALQFKIYLKKSNKLHGLGKQHKIKELGEVERKVNKKKKKINAPVKYLFKYLEKSFKTFSKVFFGWKNLNKIRAFRSSKVKGINKQVFKVLSKQVRASINFEDRKKYSLLYDIEEPINTLDFYNKVSTVEIRTFVMKHKKLLLKLNKQKMKLLLL